MGKKMITRKLKEELAALVKSIAVCEHAKGEFLMTWSIEAEKAETEHCAHVAAKRRARYKIYESGAKEAFNRFQKIVAI